MVPQASDPIEYYDQNLVKNSNIFSGTQNMHLTSINLVNETELEQSQYTTNAQ